MNWSDEHYVKLFTRDSLTWRSWGWEARTVLMHLLRKVDGSGFIETGRMDPTDALVLQLELPHAVVEPGLAQLLADGTAEAVDRALLLPKFVEAQESRKSDRQKKKDERDRNIAKRRGRVSPAVTSGHSNGPSSPAQPSPAQPEKLAGEKPPAPPKAEKATDPRHAPLVKALCEATPEYTFGGGRDAKAVSALLTLGEPDEVVLRWRRAWGRSGYPTVRTLSELVTHWNHFATAGPAVAAAPLDKHTKTGRLEL